MIRGMQHMQHDVTKLPYPCSFREHATNLGVHPFLAFMSFACTPHMLGLVGVLSCASGKHQRLVVPAPKTSADFLALLGNFGQLVSNSSRN